MENVFGEIKRVTAIVIVQTVQMSHRHAVSFVNTVLSTFKKSRFRGKSTFRGKFFRERIFML